MKRVLIDTDICVFRIRGLYNLHLKFDELDETNAFLSEITIAELRFGAERGKRKEEQHCLVDLMCEQFTVLPITESIRLFAEEKAKLWSAGTKIEDFDLLIGSTAIYHDLTLITNNTRHFSRLRGLKMENWITEKE